MSWIIAETISGIITSVLLTIFSGTLTAYITRYVWYPWIMCKRFKKHQWKEHDLTPYHLDKDIHGVEVPIVCKYCNFQQTTITIGFKTIKPPIR